MTHEEKWLPITAFEGVYEVSSLGRVKSLARISYSAPKGVRIPRPVHETILKTNSRRGYKGVTLRAGQRSKCATVHRLVCEAFHGPCPEGMQAAHLNGDKTDNRAENLKWVTPKENMAHQEMHGTKTRGEKAGRSKLFPDQVLNIRERDSAPEGVGSYLGGWGGYNW